MKTTPLDIDSWWNYIWHALPTEDVTAHPFIDISLYCLLDDMNRISCSTDPALASDVCAWPFLDLYTRVCRCEFSTSCHAVLFCYFIEEWECGSLLVLKQHWFITLFNVHTRVKIWSTSWCQTVFLVFWSWRFLCWYWSHACCLVLGSLDRQFQDIAICL